MITKSDLEKTDSGKMFKIYDDWPEIAKNAYFKAETKFRKPVKHIVFAGMGGSGTMGDFFYTSLTPWMNPGACRLIFGNTSF